MKPWTLPLLGIALLIPALASCAWTAPGEVLPAWLKSELDQSSRFPVAVWKARYHGKTAYLFVSPCCDLPNPLYSETGIPLCAPTGGFTGGGDRKCVSQPGDNYEVKLIWRRSGPPSS